MESKAKKYKRVLEGIVVSDKMDKTIVVKVESKQSKDKKFRLTKIVKKAERIEKDSMDSDVEGVLKREKHAPEASVSQVEGE